MDAITLLKADHKMVNALFKAFEKSSNAFEKRRLVNSMIEELSVHAAIEEEIFYLPARSEAEDTTDTVLEAIEEHSAIGARQETSE